MPSLLRFAGDCILLSLVTPARSQYGLTIKVDWQRNNGFALPVLDLNPHSFTAAREEDEAVPSNDRSTATREDEAVLINDHSSTATREDEPLPNSNVLQNDPLQAADSNTLHQLIMRLGGKVPTTEEVDSAGEAQLRHLAAKLLKKASLKTLQLLVKERGGPCAGCKGRREYSTAVLDLLAANAPVVAAHALPCFLYNEPLFPHTSKSMHLFEGRYKVMVERALLGDRSFGFISGEGIGTLAHITDWQMVGDGRALVSVSGGTRFTVTHLQTESCAGCDSGPLHLADVRFFNDTATEAAAEAASAEALAKQSLLLYHSLTDSTVQAALEAQHGALPSLEQKGSYTVSMWLAAACTSHPTCAKEADALLRGSSTTERIRRVVRVQKALLGGKAPPDAPSAASKRRARSSVKGVRLRTLSDADVAALDGDVDGHASSAAGEGAHPSAWHGKLLLAHPDVARARRQGRVLLLAQEPRAAGQVLRGVDVLTPAGVPVRDATRPEFRDDFYPHLDAAPLSLGGDDREGTARCGFLALHTLRGLSSTREMLSGELQLTDLQLDYQQGGQGDALRALKDHLGTLAQTMGASKKDSSDAVKMISGCNAWSSSAQLKEQMALGLWRAVDVVAGQEELAAILVRTHKLPSASLALWEALWRLSEQSI